jgi:hypothetical protein
MLLGAGIWLAILPYGKAQTLYEAGLGTLPEAQGWIFPALGVATEVFTNNSVVLDTSALSSTYAGWVNSSSLILNRVNGFGFLVTALVNAEAHVSTNRAGFSILVLADDQRGIELGFWTNTIFAQSDSPLFTHAEEAHFPTSDGFVDYTLTIQADQYVLRANRMAILSGPVRDYTAFNGTINPYRTPNFIFLGDDTTSAGASVSVRRLALIPAPRLSMDSRGVVSWVGVSNQVYEAQVSTNLQEWTTVGTVSSDNDSFHFTNILFQPSQFVRVKFP